MRQGISKRQRVKIAIWSLLWLASTAALVQLYFFLSH